MFDSYVVGVNSTSHKYTEIYANIIYIKMFHMKQCRMITILMIYIIITWTITEIALVYQTVLCLNFIIFQF